MVGIALANIGFVSCHLRFFFHMISLLFVNVLSTTLQALSSVVGMVKGTSVDGRVNQIGLKSLMTAMDQVGYNTVQGNGRDEEG